MGTRNEKSAHAIGAYVRGFVPGVCTEGSEIDHQESTCQYPMMLMENMMGVLQSVATKVPDTKHVNKGKPPLSGV
jgi:hypothetical protein